MTDWGGQLDQLVRQRGDALLRYAWLLTGDASAAEEIVQDALVGVMTRNGNLRDPGAVEGYVRRAILSRYVDGYRRRRRWVGVRHLLVAPPSTGSAADDVDARTDVVAALAVLAPRVRACVVLRYYEDLSVAETADQLGLSVGTVKRYTSDGIRALERVLGPVRSASDHDTVTVTATGGPARPAPPGGDADGTPQHPETPRSAR
ncbi:SigE family RNA polymerase sigma factor [Cellulomonas soli]|uniref:RNA polymerase sigma factor n=1 Tax=Cellulomonas soli TaxID=931535 RepID=A0A512PGH2_9CELL|nr:SigE family RNA polymerase sigma factor [Cellulomonas soli]NYI58118.1 RNA polymerase sigma-70 factor (sigma-E family) [Cellulomonas soli]GEP70252.1 RNA polymerase sigma factor [Cellulomonas soli]